MKYGACMSHHTAKFSPFVYCRTFSVYHVLLSTHDIHDHDFYQVRLKNPRLSCDLARHLTFAIGEYIYSVVSPEIDWVFGI